MKVRYQGIAQGLHRNAVNFFKSGNYQEASNLWTDLYEDNEHDVIAIKGIACCYILDNKFREAERILLDATRIAAKDAEITNMLALCYIHSGNSQEAIDKILQGMELQPSPLLSESLNMIKNLKDPEMGKIISLIPHIQITLPRTSTLPNIDISSEHLRVYGIPSIIAIIFISIIIFYPNLRNTVTSLNIRNRGEISPATEVDIKDIKDIINARENFRIILDEKVIARKFNELKQAINDQHPNRAKILVNELLASNASLGVKERVEILSSFIVDSSIDNIDYVPRYAEIAVAPSIYEGIMVRWQGTIANIHHQGRKQTTFDLLINFLGFGQVEGMAAVEVAGLQEYNNGDKITVIGKILGITKDNRVIVDGLKILKHQ